MNCSPPGSSVHGILQARSGSPFSSPGDLPNPDIKPRSVTLQANSYHLSTRKAEYHHENLKFLLID